MGIETSFPVFEADQVLTNNHLNDLRIYLDRQERLTRAKLIGSGIVCGLELKSGSSSIKISKGCALTSQGYLVMFCDKEYKFYIPYTPPKLPEHLDLIQQCNGFSGIVPFYNKDFSPALLQLVTEEDYQKLDEPTRANAASLTEESRRTLDEYAIVVFLEAEELNLKNCDTNDCNDKGSRMDFEPKVLLVKKGILDKIKSRSLTGTTPLSPIDLKRYNVPVKSLLNSSAVLQAFADITDNETIDNLNTVLNAAYTNYSYLLEEGLENPFVDIGNTLKTTRQKILQQAPVNIQYFYDHLDDLVKAYHEFRKKAFNVHSECCMDEMRFPLHIMLGEANINTQAGRQSAYREYFIYSPLFDSQKYKLEEIRFLFQRLKALRDRFSPDAPGLFEKREIKITPSSFGTSLLSERCIPYYYNVNGSAKVPKLFSQWNYFKTMLGEEKTILSYKAFEYADANNKPVLDPLAYDIERFNFFRVEGHIGKQVDVALTEVVRQKQHYNLPFDIVALSADYLGAILKGEEPQCIVQDLEADYRIVITEFMCKLHDAFCSIYKFEYNPKPKASILGEAASIATTARMTARTTGPGDTIAGERATVATVLSEDDEEVTDLISKAAVTPAAIDHLALSQLISESHLVKNYVKGSLLQKLCGIKQGTIGAAYLNNIAGGVLKFPVNPSSPVKAAQLYTGFFGLIDNIDGMFKTLLSSELSELDVPAFKKQYNEFVKEVKGLSRYLDKITEKVQIFLTTCIVEILEALKDEYIRRVNEYKLARNFNYYFKKHGGIEHKAGVTIGGTFLIIYHEEKKGNRIDINKLFVNKKLGTLMLQKFPALTEPNAKQGELAAAAKELAVASTFNNPEEHIVFNEAVKKYLDSDLSIPADTRKNLLAAIGKAAVKPRFKLTQGMVIADFYVPYLCCSDCPPIAYILPEPKDQAPEIEKKEMRICSNMREFPLEPELTNTDVFKILNAGGVTFIPDTLTVSPFSMNLTETKVFNVSYTINDQQVDVTITFAVPDANFNIELKPTRNPTNNVTEEITLTLKSLGGHLEKSEWLVKQQETNISRENSGDPFAIKLFAEGFKIATIVIIHNVLAATDDKKCTAKKEFTLTAAKIRSANQGETITINTT